MDLSTAVNARATVVQTLGDHRASWDALVAVSRHPTPFASSWWIETVDPAARCLLLVLVGDELIGGLGLSRRKRAGLTLFALPGASFAAPDHLDVLSQPEHEAVVVDVLRRWFRGCGPHLLRAEGVPANSLLARVFDGQYAIRPFSTAPYLPLDPTVRPAPKSGRLRGTLRRAERRLAQRGLLYRRIEGRSADFERAIDWLVRMHGARWSGESRFLRGLPQLLPVLRAGAQAGRVEIHELLVGEQLVATMLVFDVGDRRCYYQSGRDPSHEWRGAGTVLMHAVIQDSQARGYREFDFLRGGEAYKFEWTEHERPLFRLFAAQGAVASAAFTALVTAESARPAIRRLRKALKGKTRASINTRVIATRLLASSA